MTSTLKTRQWDPAEHLETEEDIAAYLEAAFEEGDPPLEADALSSSCLRHRCDCGSSANQPLTKSTNNAPLICKISYA